MVRARVRLRAQRPEEAKRREVLPVERGKVLLQRFPASGTLQPQQVLHRTLEVRKLQLVIIEQLLQPLVEEIGKIWRAKVGQCGGAGAAQFACTAVEPAEQRKGKTLQPLPANQVNPRLANVL